jgi:hypothetical protein
MWPEGASQRELQQKHSRDEIPIKTKMAIKMGSFIY